MTSHRLLFAPVVALACATVDAAATILPGPIINPTAKVEAWGNFDLPSLPNSYVVWDSFGSVSAPISLIAGSGSATADAEYRQRLYVSATADRYYPFTGRWVAQSGAQMSFAVAIDSRFGTVNPVTGTLPVKATVQGEVNVAWGSGSVVVAFSDTTALPTFSINLSTTELVPGLSKSDFKVLQADLPAGTFLGVSMQASCTAVARTEALDPNRYPGHAYCNADVDPYFSFDQERFDAQRAAEGLPTFQLADDYEFVFSPGILNVEAPLVPEPPKSGLCLAGIALLIGIRRLRGPRCGPAAGKVAGPGRRAWRGARGERRAPAQGSVSGLNSATVPPRSSRRPAPGPGALRVLGAALLAPGIAAAAPVPSFTLNQTSSAAFSSALYAMPAIQSDQNANSVPGWDSLGRQAHTVADLVPVQPGGFRFEQDLASAWTDFQQPATGADSTLRSYARVSGYYMNGGSTNFARNELHLHDLATVENHGAGAYFNLIAHTHGTLVAGGLSNALTASASEDTIFYGVCTRGACYEVDQVTPLQNLGDSWSGYASVSALQDTPTVTVNGTWAGSTTSIAKSVSGFASPLQGIELSALLGSKSVYLGPGATLSIDVDFRGVYEVGSAAPGGFLSFGEADFSGTGLLSYSATDPLTGLPAPWVTVELASEAVPAPPSLWTFGTGLALLLALRPRRRHHRRAAGTGPVACQQGLAFGRQR